MPNVAALTHQERDVVRQHVLRLIEQEGSQTAAAERIGVTQQAISKALTGRAGFALVSKLAEGLHMQLETLLGRQAPPVPEQPQSEALTELSSLDLRGLVDHITTLSRRQLRAVFRRSSSIAEGSVELADAALELVQRLQRDHQQILTPRRGDP